MKPSTVFLGEMTMHANAAETSAVLAINPDLVDLGRANAECPPVPEFTVNMAPVHTAAMPG